MRRSRAYLGVVIKPREVIAAVSILVLLLLLVAAWVGYQSTSQEAAGQAKAEKGTTDLPKEAEITIPEITVPELAIPEPMPKLEEDISADRPLRRIPGVSDMQIIGHLQYLPGSNFRCLGASPDRGLLRRVCRSSSGDNPPVVYEVTVVEKNPGTVLSVEATAYNASDEAATEFLGYVAELSVRTAGPLNPETWVEGNISSGGTYFGNGAELRLYGTEGARTLEVVGTSLPVDDQRGKGSRPKTDRDGKDKDSRPKDDDKAGKKDEAKDKGKDDEKK